ncbi:transketolase C-terminal domain-containing protein [Agathobacter ruminis]|uniref:Pyruvate ferredoxin oxidoreductase n=1 Tax=Agathobacter ruminis TaxID=1712665 RepID=A0A2G3E2F1_9FIRM|nr:transketolase C-terminal domain-containing protein [Agathobacter ruminis]MDC7300241.1 pyruvate ferredoxin oxidoreductase [Agathobacter ruminis]PHU37283.1 pyruvate ferredoxin oxidoreductase [Agathobacter ruminis]
MARKDRMSGNEAVSYAIRQINPDVMPAFPITPSTEIPQMVSTYIANGQMDTEFIPVESEHSSMSATIGAEAAGARSLTATSSAGLALMWEELLLAASNRMPCALALVNRTLSGPLNINCDHSDGMGARDTGWIQIYAENNQEAYDNFIQAYPIAEDPRVHLPIMICQDGFITSHAVENIELLEDKEVKEFVGEYHPEEFLLNPGKPIAVGPYAVSNYVMEARRNQLEALERSKEVILEVADKFRQLSGRGFGLFEEYKTEDADYIMVIIGSAAGTAKEAVDQLREKGKKVGVLKLRVFRPFPAEEIANAIRHAKAVAIMDRTESYNTHGGPLGSEIEAGLYRAKATVMAVNYIYGLGGRDFTVDHAASVFAELESAVENETEVKQYQYIGLRE